MIIMLRVPPKFHDAIMELVNAGKYSSVENFTEMAVRNLLTLEQEYSESYL